MIRLQRIGRRNDPAFRIVVAEKARSAKSGRYVDKIGTYNPKTKKIVLSEDRAKYWLSKGAQPSGTMHNMFVNRGLIKGKKINVLPKKSPPQKAGDAAGASEAVAEEKTEAKTEARSAETVQAA